MADESDEHDPRAYYTDPIDLGEGWTMEIRDTSRGVIALELMGHGLDLAVDVPEEKVEFVVGNFTEGAKRLDHRGRRRAVDTKARS